ncbi:MAG: PepSY domain-containing protein, partial [Myxococcota bacterium]
DYSTIDQAVRIAEEQVPGHSVEAVILPGTELSGPRHYSILLKGHSGIERQLMTLAVVDASSPTEVDTRPLPGYMQALLLSEPLHFGDYGGWPLRLLWALFAVASIVLAGSGLISFALRRRKRAPLADSAPDGWEPLSEVAS